MYAAHNVWEMEDYSKRYSMAKALLEALFPVCENCVGLVWCGVLCVCHQSVSLQVLNNSRDMITDKQFDPAGPLPKDKDLLDGQFSAVLVYPTV